MKKNFLVILLLIIIQVFGLTFVNDNVLALESSSPVATSSAIPNPTEQPRIDITQTSKESLGLLEEAIKSQEIKNVWPFNPLKQAIKSSVDSGVPANTIVLLLLLPVVATVIAVTRQIIGIRGFGIFLPAALSVTFVAIGPILGVLLFTAIVIISTFVRLVTRKLKLKLQYLPRMALILWFVSFGILGILFVSPYINYAPLLKVSIFPVLVLTLLVEDFIRIQLGKSLKTAFALTTQTLVLAFVSYMFLTFNAFQRYVLLNPELVLVLTFVINILLGRYIGLRLSEYLRFKKLIQTK